MYPQKEKKEESQTESSDDSLDGDEELASLPKEGVVAKIHQQKLAMVHIRHENVTNSSTDAGNYNEVTTVNSSSIDHLGMFLENDMFHSMSLATAADSSTHSQSWTNDDDDYYNSNEEQKKDDAVSEDLISNRSSSSMDDTMMASIEAIREEASRVDTVIALDQLDSIKEELRSTKRRLVSKSIELAELRALIKVKDMRLGTLELERDLYKADAAKMKTDIECHIRKLHNQYYNSNKSSPTLANPRTLLQVDPNDRQIDEIWTSTSAAEADLNSVAALSSRSKNEVPSGGTVADDPNQPVATTKSVTWRKNHHQASVSSSSLQLVGDDVDDQYSAAAFHPTMFAVRTAVEAANSSCWSTTQSIASNVNTNKNNNNGIAEMTPTKPRNLSSRALSSIKCRNLVRCLFPSSSSCRKENNSSSRCHHDDQYLTEQEQKKVSDMTGISLINQMEALNKRLDQSIKTSEELRRRLSMLRRYYENLVRRLQEKLTQLKVGKVQMEKDLVNQIAVINLDKRTGIELLESKLHEKDMEIAKLKCCNTTLCDYLNRNE